MEAISVFSPSIDEKRWVSQGSRTLDSEYIIELDSIPTIFQVPKTMNETKPEAYTPQLLGLGPYHHLRPDLYNSTMQKLVRVKEIFQQNSSKKFENFMDKMRDLEPVVRANYDKFLDLEGSTLDYIMAVDSLYLLGFLGYYEKTAAENLKPGVRELAKDVVMLENQIPAFALVKMWKELDLLWPVRGTHEQNTEEDDFEMGKEEDLFSVQEAMWYYKLSYGFCKVHSPLKLAEEIYHGESQHLLAHMYHMIVNNDTERSYYPYLIGGGYTEMGDCLTILRELGLGGALINPLLFTFKSLQVLVNSKLAGVLTRNEEQKPKVQKIEIPSASELSEKHHVQFHPICSGGIRNIKLFTNRLKEPDIFLPRITLGCDSKVVLRNLVAYEAAAKPTLELAEYVDLMCGIVHTPKDVALLRKRRIVKGDLNDEQVTEIFSGISRSVGKSKEESASQRVVKQVKEMAEEWENRKWYRRQYRFLKKIVKTAAEILRKPFGIAMKYLTFIFMVLLLLLQILQAYCQVYGCNIGGSKANAISLMMAA